MKWESAAAALLLVPTHATTPRAAPTAAATVVRALTVPATTTTRNHPNHANVGAPTVKVSPPSKESPMVQSVARRTAVTTAVARMSESVNAIQA